MTFSKLNAANPLPDRCKTSATDPCFYVWWVSARFDGSGWSFDEEENALEISRPRSSKVNCVVQISYDVRDGPIAGLAVRSTGDSGLIKIQPALMSTRDLSHAEIEIEHFEVKLASGDVRVTNLKTDHLDVAVEKGSVYLMGLSPRTSLANSVDRNAHVVRVGRSLGGVSGIGRWDVQHGLDAAQETCAATGCGGNIKISLLEPAEISYSQPDGGSVCMSAPAVSSNVSDADSCPDLMAANASAGSAASVNESLGFEELASECTGSVVLANDAAQANAASAEALAYPRMFAEAIDGSVLISLALYEYDSEAKLLKNIRGTVTDDGEDGDACVFPFRYEDQQFSECTSAKLGRPWCATSKSASRNPNVLDSNRSGWAVSVLFSRGLWWPVVTLALVLLSNTLYSASAPASSVLLSVPEPRWSSSSALRARW